jgi:hypothetical protein
MGSGHPDRRGSVGGGQLDQPGSVGTRISMDFRSRFLQAISGGDSLRGRLDVGGISMGIGAGLIRLAGRGQWERPAGRWVAGGWNRFVRAAAVDFGILRG